MKKMYDVQIEQTSRFVSSIYAESEDDAIALCKKLYESDVLEFDSEDIVATNYTIKK